MKTKNNEEKNIMSSEAQITETGQSLSQNMNLPVTSGEILTTKQLLELHQYSDGKIIVFYKPKMTEEEFKIVSTLNTIFKKAHKLNIDFKLTEDKQLQLWQK